MGSKTDSPYAKDFGVGGLALGFRVNESVNCALTYAQPFGADGSYREDAQNAEYATATMSGIDANPTSAMSFSSKEYAATCGYGVHAGVGKLTFIGGLFYETFEYHEDTWIGSVALKDSGKVGFRLGAAYEIPEYAMRFEVLYRSAVDHNGSGPFTASELGESLGFPSGLPSHGTGTMPQSLLLSAQSGIAPDWLAYGSIKWTDWSVLPHFAYTVDGLGTSNKVFNYQDGYAVRVGIGHQITKALAASVELGWDKGVGSGADLASDTWTLGLGLQYATAAGTFAVGASVNCFTPASQSASKGATYDAKADTNWGTTVGVTYTLAF